MAPVLALAMAAAAPTGVTAAEREAVGLVDKVQARARAHYQDEARLLAERSDIRFLDRLRTGPAARLQATLRDGTQLTLGEHAALEIDAYIYDPDKSAGKVAVEVIEGAFLFVGGLIEDWSGENVTITTPVGSLAVRGTTVWGGSIDGGYGVLVLDGQVTVDTSAGSVTLTEGEGTMILDLTQPPGAPVTWPQEKVDRAVQTISFR